MNWLWAFVTSWDCISYVMHFFVYLFLIGIIVNPEKMFDLCKKIRGLPRVLKGILFLLFIAGSISALVGAYQNLAFRHLVISVDEKRAS